MPRSRLTHWPLLLRYSQINIFEDYIYSAYIYIYNFLADITSDAIIRSKNPILFTCAEGSFTTTMPRNPESKAAEKETRWVRALYAVPLLPIVYVCHKTMGTATTTLVVEKGLPGTISLGNGEVVSLCTKFYGINGFDNFISIFVGLFTVLIGGFDPVGKMQAIAFLGDLVPIQTIWMIEAIRRGNVGTAAQLL